MIYNDSLRMRTGSEAVSNPLIDSRDIDDASFSSTNGLRNEVVRGRGGVDEEKGEEEDRIRDAHFEIDCDLTHSDSLLQTPLALSAAGNSTSTMSIGMSLNSILALKERTSSAPSTISIPQNTTELQQQQQQHQLQSRKSSAGTVQYVRSNAPY